MKKIISMIASIAMLASLFVTTASAIDGFTPTEDKGLTITGKVTDITSGVATMTFTLTGTKAIDYTEFDEGEDPDSGDPIYTVDGINGVQIGLFLDPDIFDLSKAVTTTGKIAGATGTTRANVQNGGGQYNYSMATSNASAVICTAPADGLLLTLKATLKDTTTLAKDLVVNFTYSMISTTGFDNSDKPYQQTLYSNSSDSTKRDHALTMKFGDTIAPPVPYAELIAVHSKDMTDFPGVVFEAVVDGDGLDVTKADTTIVGTSATKEGTFEALLDLSGFTSKGEVSYYVAILCDEVGTKFDGTLNAATTDGDLAPVLFSITR